MNYIKYTAATSNNWMRAITFVQKEKPWLNRRVVDSLTESQVESKMWLGTELQKIKSEFNNVAVLGGWYCHILSNIMFEHLSTKFLCNYDIDKDSKTVSYKFNRRYKEEGRYIVSSRNLFTSKLEKKQTSEDLPPIDLFINPSCEHMYYMKDIIKNHFDDKERLRPLIVLQSTDESKYDDHINCVSCPDELALQANISDIYFAGSKNLSNGMTRFMVIGR